MFLKYFFLNHGRIWGTPARYLYNIVKGFMPMPITLVNRAIPDSSTTPRTGSGHPKYFYGKILIISIKYR
jgi:hypothetical protein